MKTLFSSSKIINNHTDEYTILHRFTLPAFVRSGDLASVEYALFTTTSDCEITVTKYAEDGGSGSTQLNSGVGTGLIILKMVYTNVDNTLKGYYQLVDSNGISQSTPGDGTHNTKSILEISAKSNVGQSTGDIKLISGHGIFISEV